MINLKTNKSLADIVNEWDAIARARDDQIASGKDHSANSILAPSIIKHIPECKSLIDIGCGTGWLTERLVSKSERVAGIDPSKTSIAIARERHSGPSIKYINTSIETYPTTSTKFDAAISNMTASCAPDLDSFFVGARAILKRNAPYIFTIPHPYFWSLYWGYASHPKFRYKKSMAVEGDFKIQAESTNFITTHFHHPLERYVSAISSSGFAIESIIELSGRNYNFPRFMLIHTRAR